MTWLSNRGQTAAWGLRIAMLLSFLMHLVVIGYIWGIALAGDTEPVFEAFLDIEEGYPLDLWQILAIIAITSLLLIALGLMFWSAHRFFVHVAKGTFFVSEAARAVRGLGYGLMLFWLELILEESLMPAILTVNLSQTLRRDIDFSLLDVNFVALLVGATLLWVARALDEGRRIDDENKQII